MVQEQCEADADTSVQQRLLAGAGTAVKGTGEALIEEGEGNKDTKIAGGIDLLDLNWPCREFVLHAAFRGS